MKDFLLIIVAIFFLGGFAYVLWVVPAVVFQSELAIDITRFFLFGAMVVAYFLDYRRDRRYHQQKLKDLL